MKEVMAFIRPTKINKTKEALAEAGFPSFTARKVLGRGKKQITFDMVKDIIEEGELPVSPMGEYLTEGHRLIPKRFMTLIVKDEEVDKVVKVMIETNQTGNPGDGKIFILPVVENYRVRDGSLEEEDETF